MRLSQGHITTFARAGGFMSSRFAVGAILALVLALPSITHGQRRGGGQGAGPGGAGPGGGAGQAMQQAGGRQMGGQQGCSQMGQAAAQQTQPTTTTQQGTTTQSTTDQTQQLVRNLQLLMTQQTDLTLRQALSNRNPLIRITASQELTRRSAGVYR
jgi:hypothetical protein